MAWFSYLILSLNKILYFYYGVFVLSAGADWANGQSDHAEGPALQGGRLADNKIIKDVLIVHSNTCTLIWVT